MQGVAGRLARADHGVNTLEMAGVFVVTTLLLFVILQVGFDRYLLLQVADAARIGAREAGRSGEANRGASAASKRLEDHRPPNMLGAPRVDASFPSGAVRGGYALVRVEASGMNVIGPIGPMFGLDGERKISSTARAFVEHD